MLFKGSFALGIVVAFAVFGQESRIGPNTPMGEDPDSLPPGLRAQAEPHVARSFTDPNLIVAVFQEGRFRTGGAWGLGMAVSRDGGQSWRRELVPRLVRGFGQGEFERASDPVVALGPGDQVFLNGILINLTDDQRLLTSIGVIRSEQVHAPFDAPVLLERSEVPEVLPDKNWIAVDSFSGSPHEGRIAVAYAIFDSSGAQRKRVLNLRSSDDGGRSWSPRQPITPALAQGAQPMFLPDGALAVVYWNFLAIEPRITQGRIEAAISLEGGDRFQAPSAIADVKVYSDPVARDGAILPSATVDRQAGVIYVVYQADSGRRIEVVPSIMFSKSIDRGQTWSQPVKVNDSPPRRSIFSHQSAFSPAIAVSPDGQDVTVVFYDKRDATDSNHVDLYLAESLDGGDTWGPNQRVSEQSSDLELAPLTPTGRMFGDYIGIVPSLNRETPGVAVWIDTRSGTPDPFSARIFRLQGTSFETWRRLRFAEDELALAAVSGETADPDRDGFSNLEEYAFGMEPDRVDTSPFRITMDRRLTSSSLRISYRRLAVLGDLDFSWVSSIDLRTWRTAAPGQESVSISRTDPTLEIVESRFSLEQGKTRFFRLMIRRTF